MTRAIDQQLSSCHFCSKLNEQEASHCSYCGSKLHQRKKDSLLRAWVFLITAAILFFPANLLPIMYTTKLSSTRADTIMSGIIKLWNEGMVPIAIIVFIASIVTPLIKILGLLYIMWNDSPDKPPVIKTKIYRFLHFIGKWSMVDVFVVALLGALIQGDLSSVRPGFAIFAFTGVVFFTMLATEAFDTRHLWDQYNFNKRESIIHE